MTFVELIEGQIATRTLMRGFRWYPFTSNRAHKNVPQRALDTAVKNNRKCLGLGELPAGLSRTNSRANRLVCSVCIVLKP